MSENMSGEMVGPVVHFPVGLTSESDRQISIPSTDSLIDFYLLIDPSIVCFSVFFPIYRCLHWHFRIDFID